MWYLSLVFSFVMKGYKVYSTDTNQELIDELKSGISYHLESYNSRLILEILKKIGC
mgnify:CR=1 FL=1